VLSTRVLIGSLVALIAGMALAFAASASQRGTPSTATIYFTEPNEFDGKVASNTPECVDDRRMAFKKVRKGPDRALGRKKITKNGGWAGKNLKEDVERGRFYVKVDPASYPGGGTCLPAKSATTTIGQ
jgi:hypothetical protein